VNQNYSKEFCIEDAGNPGKHFMCPVILGSQYPSSALSNANVDFTTAAYTLVYIHWFKMSFVGTVQTDHVDYWVPPGSQRKSVTAYYVKSAPSIWDYSMISVLTDQPIALTGVNTIFNLP